MYYSDFHGRVHKTMAKQLAKALEPHRPLFIEEPLLPGQDKEIKNLYGQTTIPIAVCIFKILIILLVLNFVFCHLARRTALY